MPTLPRTVTSPKKFIIGQHLLPQLHEHVKDFGDYALLISDEFILERVREEALAGLLQAGLRGVVDKFRYECTEQEIHRLTHLAEQYGANVIVGIGGGKTLDVAKAVAFYLRRPVVLFPTIASTDAPCTALAVIYNQAGEFERYLFLPQNPDVVLADTAIIAAAPPRFFSAGVGDALATYFEARACYRSDGLNLVGKRPSRTGLGLAQLCYELLGENIELAMDAIRHHVSTPALEQVIEATIYLSGVGAEAGGLAAAHAVNNGMSLIAELHRAQHGEKVVFGLLTQLVLERAPQHELDEVFRIIDCAGLPMTLQELGLTHFDESEWRKVAQLACDPLDTMGNMPMTVSEQDVYAAVVAANAMAERYRLRHPRA